MAKTNSGTFYGQEGSDGVRYNFGSTFDGGAGNDLVGYNEGTFNGGDGTDTVVVNEGTITNDVEIFPPPN